jgi:hypothetical protein
MATEVQSMPKPGGAPKRRLRNYLLDARFQLKYTAMVVIVTALVASGVGAVLGYQAYDYSRGMTEMLLMQQVSGMEVDDATHRLFEQEAREEDSRVLVTIVIGITALVVLLSFALGLTGIVVTHKVVGPAYKLRLLLGEVERGSLNVKGGFRKGDELQELGDAFKRMVIALRERREDELAQLDAAIEKAREKNVDDGVVGELTALRDRLERTLQS